jgi:hypothetical protein
MTTVLTTTMTLRIILSVRGSLAQGGSYTGSTIASSTARGTSTHVLSSNSGVRAGGQGQPQQPHATSFGQTASNFGVQSTGAGAGGNTGGGILNIGGYTGDRKGSLGLGAGGGSGVGKEGGAYTLDEMRDKAARGD